MRFSRAVFVACTAAVCLVLLIADPFPKRSSTTYFAFANHQLRLVTSSSELTVDDSPEYVQKYRQWVKPMPVTIVAPPTYAGQVVQLTSNAPAPTLHQLHVPCNPLIPLLALVIAPCAILLTVDRWRQFRRDALASARKCIVCRYDLRSSPDRCPECGTVVRASTVDRRSPV